MKVGNRSKVGNREQRMQDRHARLVAQVNQLVLENGDLKRHILANDCGNGIDSNGNFTRVLTDNGSINLLTS